MSGYNELKNAIRRVVKTNNNREITGQNLQSTLTSMVNSLGANYHFAGFASPDTNPGTPDQNIFYIASEEGTYVNFDGINLEPGLSFLMWNGKWSSETISVGEVTKSWVQQNYVSIAFFNELFELYNDSTKIAVNDTIPVDKDKLNIKAMFGFWTEQYISALGKNDSGGSGSGVDMATVWSALARSTDEQINKSHLTTALSGYATISWVSQIFATITSIPTKLSQLANDTGFITSAALPTKLSQLANDTGFITHQDISGKADRSELLGYLPLSGGTMTGDITFNYGGSTSDQFIHFKASDKIKYSFGIRRPASTYGLCFVYNGSYYKVWHQGNLTSVSQLTNDTGFITSAALPTKVSQLVNDAGYVTASIVNGYATQSWVSQNYVSVEFFERLFQAYSGTTKVDTNSTSAIDNIKAMFGFWTEQYISALGKNDSGGSGSGVDMATVWSALAGSTDEQINKSHLTTTLSEYATQSWVSQIFATITSIPTKLSQLANDTGFITSAALPTKLSQLANDTGFITSAALPTKLSQLANDTGFITHQDISGKADRSELLGYLPLSGGTMTGDITFNYGGSTSDQFIHFKASDKIKYSFGIRRPASTYGLCFVYNGSYYKVWHQGNDGADSGLDADKLDGQHGSYYAAASSLANYLPLSGGTLTNNSTDVVLSIVSNDTTAWIGWKLSDSTFRYIGVDTSNNLKFQYNGVSYNVIHSGNIGSQSVNYATSAGYADSAAQVTNSLSWSGYSSGSYNGSTVQSISIPNNTNQLVNGAGYITSSASITGNAATATKLQTARTIWGQSFDGTDNITGRFTCDRVHIGKTDELWCDTALFIQHGNLSSANVYICASSSGNVGIGTTSPSYKLDVTGGVRANRFVASYGEVMSSFAIGSGVYNRMEWTLTPNHFEFEFPNATDSYSGSHFPIYFGWRGGIYPLAIAANTNVGIGTTTPTHKLHVIGDMATTGRATVDSLQIGNITIIYDAANKGLRIAGGGLYTDSYLSSLGVDASTALSVKKWADSINLTEESDAELATAYSIGNLYRLINSNQESITQSLNQSVSALQGRCTSLEQRVSALENKVNK